MKLANNFFENLFSSVLKMGVKEFRDFKLRDVKPREKIDVGELSSRTGKIIPIDKVDIIGDVFSWEGNHILLFIPEHSYNRFDLTIVSPSEGNKYHLTFCKTLEDMREKGRFARYYATNNTSGYFNINDGNHREQEVRLNVCKNCLTKLNYKNYIYNRDRVFREFNLVEFFQYYSSFFQKIPEYKYQDKVGYSENWHIISHKYRKLKHYICEECGINLNSEPHLLHTHHIDGNKQNNEEDNLKAICIECHSKQPMHNHMIVSEEDSERLARLRSRQ